MIYGGWEHIEPFMLSVAEVAKAKNKAAIAAVKLLKGKLKKNGREHQRGFDHKEEVKYWTSRALTATKKALKEKLKIPKNLLPYLKDNLKYLKH